MTWRFIFFISNIIAVLVRYPLGLKLYSLLQDLVFFFNLSYELLNELFLCLLATESRCSKATYIWKLVSNLAKQLKGPHPLWHCCTLWSLCSRCALPLRHFDTHFSDMLWEDGGPAALWPPSLASCFYWQKASSGAWGRNIRQKKKSWQTCREIRIEAVEVSSGTLKLTLYLWRPVW